MLGRSVLILGDGNFSFSQSFIRQVEDFSLVIGPEVAPTITTNSSTQLISKVICSSFDSLDVLIKKYPETEHKLKDLQNKNRRSWVFVYHEIDATRIRESFHKLHLAQEEVDDIIFNFPHLGFEDIQAHQCLLAHIMDSAKCMLKPKGSVAIALAESQGIGWNIEDIANRLGLSCFHKLPVLVSDWSGYEMKRHHTGKSFQSRVQICYHYIFRFKNENVEGNPTILEILNKIRTELRIKTNKIEDITPTSKENSLDKVPTIKPTKKRKVHQLVEGMYRLDLQNNSNDAMGFVVCNSTGILYVCTVCERRFPTEQGVKTHAYNMHVLSNNSGNRNSSEIKLPEDSESTVQDSEHIVVMPYNCNECDRNFANADALNQHKIAKHVGQHTDLHAIRGKGMACPLSSSSSGSKDESIAIPSEWICDVCLLKFSSLDSFIYHKEKDFIPVDAGFEFSCSQCQKKFNEERAWKQHSNFCLRRPEIRESESCTL